jgi:uncharacterized protein (DUF433 family)
MVSCGKDVGTMKRKKVREIVGGEEYEFHPLGKYTRIEVEGVLQLLGTGYSLKRLVENYQGRVPAAAIREATELAGKALKEQNAS